MKLETWLPVVLAFIAAAPGIMALFVFYRQKRDKLDADTGGVVVTSAAEIADTAREMMAPLRAELKEARAEIGTLKQENKTLREEIARLIGINEAQHQEIFALKLASERAASDLASIRRDYTALEAKMVALEAKNVALSDRVQHLENENGDLREWAERLGHQGRSMGQEPVKPRVRNGKSDEQR